MKTLKLLLVLVVVLFGARASLSADQTPDADSLVQEIYANAPASQTISPQAAAQSDASYAAWRIEEVKNRRLFILTLIGAALISLVIVLGFLRLTGTASTETIVSGSGLVLVIYATVMVEVIAQSDQQLTATIGILGATAGYLFGSASKLRGVPTANGAPRAPEN